MPPTPSSALYDNWCAFVSDARLLRSYEVPLFSDSHVVDEVADGIGPYALLNTVGATFSPRELRPAMLARMSLHINLAPFGSSGEKTEDSRYHGGSIDDELAALMSLVLGARFEAGRPTREFDAGGDPRGRPLMWSHEFQPRLSTAFMREPVIPALVLSKDASECRTIATLPSLAPDQAVALLKAARLYQQGVWVADAEPSLAWIFLVSAIETAAAHWQGQKSSPLERLRFGLPDVATELERVGGPEHAARIAGLLASRLGATQRFADFVLAHAPEPPSERPPENSQFSYEPAMFLAALRKIYGYRSSALHGGIPFPPPMCSPPIRFSDQPSRPEVPVALSTQSYSGYWLRKDVPAHLHTWEHIVRGALLKWFKSMSGEPRQG